MAIPNLDIRPMAGALGAEIHGFDLARDLDEDGIRAVRRALLDHQALVFHDQVLDMAGFVAVGRTFGTLAVHPFVRGPDGFPEVMELIKEKDGRKNVGGNWHSDQTFLPRPLMATMLYAIETPTHGGDTMVANAYAAWDALSDGLKATLSGMRAVHSAARAYGDKAEGDRFGKDDLRSMKIVKNEAAEEPVSHPVARTHPETGRKALFVNELLTQRFDGMTEEESLPLLRWLWAHAVRPEFTCRIRWRPGTLALWDNRCTQHYALNDYHGQRRHLWRVTMEGDTPV